MASNTKNPDFVSLKLQGESSAVQRMLDALLPMENQFTRFRRPIKIGTNPKTKSIIVAAYLEISTKNFHEIIRSQNST